ncbi:MAG: hypothetical protein KZQ99_14845 [Candidatus Thiodiazotropha sp. (ex Dulcina madagascariensis)]|nr:hypothetical protein [Candidatus Thiodiazotropha sp. (ex Dulcina madagascariensis)]
MRTQAYSSASGTNTGKAYQLVFMDHASGVIGNGPVNRVVLYNTDCENNNCTLTELTDTPLNLGHRGPFDVAVRLEGGQIALSVDGSLIFDIQDPEPLYYGGIGIHNIWESHAHYDNFQVSSVPLPAALPLFASAFFTLGFIGRKYRRQESSVGDTFRRILENGRTGERL